MLIQDPQTTARQAADIFARAYSDTPRRVGEIKVFPPSSEAPLGGIDFKLEGGVRWYSVRMKHDNTGWLVTIAE